MAFDVYFRDDIQRSILSGLVLAVHTARAGNAYNLEFLTGAVVAFQHQALQFGLDWLYIQATARVMLGDDLSAFLDSALRTIQAQAS